KAATFVRREMGAISFELQIHASLKELSRFKNFMTASISKHATYDGYRFWNEILRDFISEFDKLCLKAVAMTGKDKQTSQCNLEKRSSSGTKVLTDSNVSAPKKIVNPQCCSSKACISNCKGKGVLQAEIVQQLNGRLKILEEETETMKKDIFGALQESRVLLNEICKQFLIIQRCICLQNPAIGQTCVDDTLAANSPKDGKMGAGLSDIIFPEPNLSLITRDLRSNMIEFDELALSTARALK
ncbi:hypothetical protein F2P56_028167, partial [Juglans regia]